MRIDTLIDTGAEISAVSDQFLALIQERYVSYVGKDNLQLYSATNDRMVSCGIFCLPFTVLAGLRRQMEHDFPVLPRLRGGMILGMDLITKFGVMIDGSNRSLVFLDTGPKTWIAKIEIGPVIDEKPESQFQLSHLPIAVENRCKELFEIFVDTFAMSMLELGCTTLCEHKIEIIGVLVRVIGAK